MSYLRYIFSGLGFDFWKPSACSAFTGDFQNGEY